jgi:hypothetical protein
MNRMFCLLLLAGFASAETAHVSGTHENRNSYTTTNYSTHIPVSQSYTTTTWELTIGKTIYDTEPRHERNCHLQVGTDVDVERTKKGFTLHAPGKKCELRITGFREGK